MADIAGVLATGGIALVSAAAGAGLTYWFGALNRRHQQAREDATRWYETRLQAYVDLSRVVTSILGLGLRSDGISYEPYEEAMVRLSTALGTIRLVGSREVIESAESLYTDTLHKGIQKQMREGKMDGGELQRSLGKFEIIARKDLGHP